MSKYNKSLATSDAPLPDEPTHHLARSPQKIAVLCERAEARHQLFHPLDAHGVWRFAMLIEHEGARQRMPNGQDKRGRNRGKLRAFLSE
jgi:hypothetical protein